MFRFVKLMLTAPKYAPSYNEFTDLAVTCSLEHFTALFAELLLCSDRGRIHFYFCKVNVIITISIFRKTYVRPHRALPQIFMDMVCGGRNGA